MTATAESRLLTLAAMHRRIAALYEDKWTIERKPGHQHLLQAVNLDIERARQELRRMDR